MRKEERIKLYGEHIYRRIERGNEVSLVDFSADEWRPHLRKVKETYAKHRGVQARDRTRVNRNNWTTPEHDLSSVSILTDLVNFVPF